MAAGPLRDRVEFYRRNTTETGWGTPTTGFAETPFCTRRGGVQVQRARNQSIETVDAGRLQSSTMVALTIRSDSITRTITEADKAVIDGVDYQIRSITNPDRREKWLELVLERGVGI